ncbi:MAG: hypothetical protein M3367_16005 [Acidobacteriota bacterium]|nr:hypothetical protein [Acidobacteriota bacterium]
MTENQEKEVFLLLNTIVTRVQGVQSDVKEIKQTVNEHSQKMCRICAAGFIKKR